VVYFCSLLTGSFTMCIIQVLRSYDDIRSRIKDAIRWWDDNGVPRYCDFSPEECGVYESIDPFPVSSL